MTLSDLASLATLVSGIAVLASLFYLSQQIRQATRHMQAQIFQSGAELAFAQSQAMADPDLAAATILGNGGTPSPEEIRRFQFQQICQQVTIVWENLFAQNAAGLAKEVDFRHIRHAFVLQLRFNPGIREHFKQLIADPDAPAHPIQDFFRGALAEAERDSPP